jgi:hypothetical protein
VNAAPFGATVTEAIQTITHRLSAAALALCLGACASSYQVGDVIKADPNAKPADAATAVQSPAAHPPTSNKKQTTELDQWNEKWQLIQSSSDSVGWVDHLRVCGIKFRYRNYDELFRCLDLFEAKAAAGKKIGHVEIVRQVTRVITDWMRSSAYSELGEPDAALRSAETAWNARSARRRRRSCSRRTKGQRAPLATGWGFRSAERSTRRASCNTRRCHMRAVHGQREQLVPRGRTSRPELRGDPDSRTGAGAVHHVHRHRIRRA